MKKYLLIGLLITVMTGCSTDTIMYEQNPEETTFALSKQAEQAPLYKVLEAKDKDIILLNSETNKQELKIVNNTGETLTIIVLLLILFLVSFIGLIISLEINS